MRRYIEHIKETRTPHERRIHALQVAGGVTALVFVVWAGTLSWRLSDGGAVAQDNGNQTVLPESQSGLTAAAAQAQAQNQAHLEVSTTSVFNN